jgi:hypothetical protein
MSSEAPPTAERRLPRIGTNATRMLPIALRRLGAPTGLSIVIKQQQPRWRRQVERNAYTIPIRAVSVHISGAQLLLWPRH